MVGEGASGSSWPARGFSARLRHVRAANQANVTDQDGFHGSKTAIQSCQCARCLSCHFGPAGHVTFICRPHASFNESSSLFLIHVVARMYLRGQGPQRLKCFFSDKINLHVEPQVPRCDPICFYQCWLWHCCTPRAPCSLCRVPSWLPS